MQNNPLSALYKEKTDLVQNLFHTKQLYRTVFPLLEQEKDKLTRRITNRQDDVTRTVVSYQQLIVASLLGFALSFLLVAALLPKKELKDHPQCGVIKDGQVSVVIQILPSSVSTPALLG